MFVRVRDNDTGHEYDVDEFDPRIGDVLEALDEYEPVRVSRPAKYRVDLASIPVAPSDPAHTLDDATVSELQSYAAEHGIDLGGATRKDDIRAAIEAATASDLAVSANETE